MLPLLNLFKSDCDDCMKNPVIAHLQEQLLLLQVQEALEFGLAPVNGRISRMLTVHNTGEAAVSCSWDISPPFNIVPVSISIAAGQSADFACNFQPPEAAVYTVLAACQTDTGYSAAVKVSNLAHDCHEH